MNNESPSPTDSPVITVVSPTYNRADLLPRLVKCLEAQEGTGPFEVIIVDDCSGDGAWDLLQELARSSTLDIRAYRNETNLGPAAARNVGWRSARAPVVAFTDDDCRPTPDWLRELVRPLDRVDIVQGRTEVDGIEAAERGPFARVQIVNEWSGLFESCNIAYRREVLERVGGFDESFRRPFGEDVDLGWRATESGATGEWEPAALVIHDVETTGSRLRDWVMWNKDAKRRVYAPLMVKRHPALRNQMHRKLFYKPHHPPTIAALCAVSLLAGRRAGRGRFAVAAALAFPWLHYRGIRAPYPARRRWLPIVLPLAFVSDVAEVAAMVVGSVRFRTVLL